MTNKRYMTRKALPKRSALAVALAVGMGISGLAFGQATSGTVFGSAPAGDTVTATSTSGATRTVVVPASGNYTVSNLPLGSYTVTLSHNGSAVSSRSSVSIAAGGATSVNFASQQNAQNLGAVTVSANALPSIDVTSVHDSTTITAAQLKTLPVQRNMTAIALLTPGTMASTAFSSNGVSSLTFGGSSATENAYYVNGYNTGDPYSNFFGFQLPYGAVAQQQTMAGAFGAKYGRSDGGVISQIGKSGTNEWHFGAQVVWQPEALMASPRNQVYPNVPMPTTLANGKPLLPPLTRGQNVPPPGSLENYNNDDKGWNTIYTAYVGGPLIKDKLYFFVDAEYTAAENHSVSALGSHQYSDSSKHETKYYGKINWNITDNNIFEFTALQQNETSGAGAQYNYDYATNTTGEFLSPHNLAYNNAKFYIGKFTSYLSDNATLQITYGTGKFHPYTQYKYPFDMPFVAGALNQDCTKAPAGVPCPITNAQPNTTVSSPNSQLDTHGLRIDFTYLLGDHTLMAGIDNMRYRGQNQGVFMTGTTQPAVTTATLNSQFADLPGTLTTADGGLWIYRPGIVIYEQFTTLGGMDVSQKAYYLQDKWQLTSNVLVNIGVRNDNYSNYTGKGQRFAHQTNQWEPRLGVSWDVFGDSSLKIYGNAGRYYLALPLSAANRAADNSTLVEGVYTYSGITKDGLPIIKPSDTVEALFSPDGEYGTKKDVKLVSSQSLKPMYMDQFHLGFDAKLDMLDTTWTYGAKLTYRELKSTIDDECSPGKIQDKMIAEGIDNAVAADFAAGGRFYNSLSVSGYCRLFNPGGSNDMLVHDADSDSYYHVPMNFSDWGFPRKPTRTYKGVNLYFAHPFDGKWFGRVDYTWTQAKGNTVGQVRPDIGQTDVSKTEDWDNPALMVGSYGDLPNTREQVLRVRGTYKLTPAWSVSMVARIQSGEPLDCLGYYGPDATGDPAGYNAGGVGHYHYCAGRIVHSGSDDPLAGHTPWLHTYNLSVNWTPAFADRRMTVQLSVYNVFNEQQQQSVSGRPSLPNSLDLKNGIRGSNPTFHMPVYENGRSAQLSVSYDY